MRLSRRLAGVVAVLAAAASIGVAAAPAQASTLGNRPLAALLPATDKFDNNPNDFDIVTHAVYAVLAAKPNSPVGVLANGNVKLTAFLPNDYAFESLVARLTGKWPTSEQATFNAVAGLGIDTVEQVLLYHVVLGNPIQAWQARRANGAVLTTAQGGTITIKTRGRYDVQFIDADTKQPNPWLVYYDINVGNNQIAHGISQVLLPITL
ncbi:MAG TPA: fasciclin domain-containing protein [Actinomycetes bacterium]|nr:fasciclin domain-containing protein [Actinomycetes bacterium]